MYKSYSFYVLVQIKKIGNKYIYCKNLKPNENVKDKDIKIRILQYHKNLIIGKKYSIYGSMEWVNSSYTFFLRKEPKELDQRPFFTSRVKYLDNFAEKGFIYQSYVCDLMNEIKLNTDYKEFVIDSIYSSIKKAKSYSDNYKIRTNKQLANKFQAYTLELVSENYIFGSHRKLIDRIFQEDFQGYYVLSTEENKQGHKTIKIYTIDLKTDSDIDSFINLLIKTNY